MEEENITFQAPKGIFFNPAMRFCRSMSSLAVGAIGAIGTIGANDKIGANGTASAGIEIIDAFSASGIRGIRYAKENRDVSGLTFIDIEKRAIAAAKKNAKANKLKAAGVALNISRAAFEHTADFIEIDPFGTPSPYLADAMRFLNNRKEAYLSVTATDVAVLCGGKLAACMKNYQARPLNCTFTHEIGLRIMIRRIVDVAAEFNMGAEPLASFSDQHYLKSVLKLKRSAEAAFESQKKAGHITLCRICGWRKEAQFPVPNCEFCGSENAEPETTPKPGTQNSKPGIDWAGPLWLGELHDRGFIRAMKGLNNKRDYADKEKIGKFFSLMEGEVGMPPYYYNLHEICKLHRIQPVPKFDDVLERLATRGFKATRTHFSPISIKTDAPLHDIMEASGWKN